MLMRCPVSKCMPETVLDSGSIGCAGRHFPPLQNSKLFRAYIWTLGIASKFCFNTIVSFGSKIMGTPEKPYDENFWAPYCWYLVFVSRWCHYCDGGVIIVMVVLLFHSWWCYYNDGGVNIWGRFDLLGIEPRSPKWEYLTLPLNYGG